MKLYCKRCKAKKEAINYEEAFVTKEHRVIKSRCSGCGCGIYKIIKKKKIAKNQL